MTEVVTPRGGGASHARPVGKFYTYCGRDTHGGWKVLPLPAPVVCIRCKKAGAPRWVEPGLAEQATKLLTDMGLRLPETGV